MGLNTGARGAAGNFAAPKSNFLKNANKKLRRKSLHASVLVLLLESRCHSDSALLYPRQSWQPTLRKREAHKFQNALFENIDFLEENENFQVGVPLLETF